MEQRPFPMGAQPAPFASPPPLPLETDQAAVVQALAARETAASEHLAVLEARVKELVQQIHKRSNRIALVISGSVFTLFGVLFAACLPFTGILPSICFWFTLFAGLGFLGWTIYTDGMLRSRSEQVARTLAQVKDLRAVGPLIDTFRLPSDYNHRTSIDALIRLLPHIEPGDAELLTAGRCAILWNNLSRPVQVSKGGFYASSETQYNREIDFCIAVLQAFTQAGDSRVIPVVAQLAQEKAKNQGEQRIQQAAQICLNALRERAGQRYNNQTLLRAADAADTGAEILLRPVTGAQETPPDQLLRPGLPDP